VKSPVVLVIVMLALSSGGCGTVCNFVGAVTPVGDEKEVRPPLIYGGIQMDFNVLAKLDTSKPLFTPSQGGDGRDAAFALLFIPALLLAEGSLTLVGDTLTLPITIPLNMPCPPWLDFSSRKPTAAKAADPPAVQLGAPASAPSAEP
jgi:hypothetical protein